MKKIQIKDFSPSLFWDIDKSTLDLEKHKRFIIERTLTHGTLTDWFLLKNYYGKKTIKEESMQVRYLDKLTLNFCATYFKVPIQQFRCYILQQSNPTHWDY